MNTSSAISVIRNLSDKDLIEALYEIVQDQYGNWKVDLLALHDPKKYDSEWSEDVSISQEASTVENLSVFCWAKKMICPITGNSLNGT